eukprot:COSAG01_NODE_3828_length_5655_cov_3.721742_6_plen_99_part_00
MRVEHLIPTQEHHAHSKVKPPVPLEINAATSSIANVVVRNVSWAHVGNAESRVTGSSPLVNVSDVLLQHLVMDGRVAQDAHEAHIHIEAFASNVTVRP